MTVAIGETDIPQLKVGQPVTVAVDAMPLMNNLPAEITHISPTATIQSGVVNYEVEVGIKSLEAVRQGQGNIPEQAQAKMEQWQQRQGEQQPQMPSQLREGLTVTVTITIEEKDDVLLVPNAAITCQGQETYVRVLKDGVTEQRSITTGINNLQYTEVTSGLSEGEKVIVQGKPATPPRPQEEGGGPPMPFGPGGKPH